MLNRVEPLSNDGEQEVDGRLAADALAPLRAQALGDAAALGELDFANRSQLGPIIHDSPAPQNRQRSRREGDQVEEGVTNRQSKNGGEASPTKQEPGGVEGGFDHEYEPGQTWAEEAVGDEERPGGENHDGDYMKQSGIRYSFHGSTDSLDSSQRMEHSQKEGKRRRGFSEVLPPSQSTVVVMHGGSDKKSHLCFRFYPILHILALVLPFLCLAIVQLEPDHERWLILSTILVGLGFLLCQGLNACQSRRMLTPS
jgi:hypothetical protein